MLSQEEPPRFLPPATRERGREASSFQKKLEAWVEGESQEMQALQAASLSQAVVQGS
jgi:hypothetical protein